MKSFSEWLHEEAVAANCAGGGQIAGIGVGAWGEPGYGKKRKNNNGQPVVLRRRPAKGT